MVTVQMKRNEALAQILKAQQTVDRVTAETQRPVWKWDAVQGRIRVDDQALLVRAAEAYIRTLQTAIFEAS